MRCGLMAFGLMAVQAPLPAGGPVAVVYPAPLDVTVTASSTNRTVFAEGS